MIGTHHMRSPAAYAKFVIVVVFLLLFFLKFNEYNSQAQPRVVNWVDASNHLMEASDVAVHEKSIYVTDFRGHGVHVFSHEGTVAY